MRLALREATQCAEAPPWADAATQERSGVESEMPSFEGSSSEPSHDCFNPTASLEEVNDGGQNEQEADRSGVAQDWPRAAVQETSETEGVDAMRRIGNSET